MRKLFSRSVAIAALSVPGLLLASATPASAAYTDCPGGSACLWTTNNYPGSPNGSFASALVLSGTNNLINSIVNNGNNSVARFYDASNYTGTYISLNNPARGGQSRDPMLSNGTDATSVNWSNRISSALFL